MLLRGGCDFEGEELQVPVSEIGDDSLMRVIMRVIMMLLAPYLDLSLKNQK